MAVRTILEQWVPDFLSPPEVVEYAAEYLGISPDDFDQVVELVAFLGRARRDGQFQFFDQGRQPVFGHHVRVNWATGIAARRDRGGDVERYRPLVSRQEIDRLLSKVA